MPDQETSEEFDISFDDILVDTPAAEETPAAEPKAEITELETKPEVKPEAEAEETPAEEPPVETPAATTEEEPPAEEPPAEEDDSVVAEIMTHFGYEIEEEFEDTPEGLKELTKTIGEKMTADTLDQLFEKYPSVKEHLEFAQQGGDPRQFMSDYAKEVEYSNIEVKEDDVKTQKALLQHYFAARGDEKEFIQDTIDMYEDKGVLLEKSGQAKTALANAQKGRREAAMEWQRLEAKTREEEAVETWKTVTELVKKSDSLGGIPVAQRERSRFLDYISKPMDANGNTQRDLDNAKLSLEQQLTADYLLFKGMKLDSFIGKKARTAASESLKDRLSKNTAKAKGHRTDTPASDVVESLDLDITNL